MDWATLLGLAATPLSLGLSMAAKTRGEFRFVKACLWLAASAIIGNHLVGIWQSGKPIGVLGILVAAAIGAAVTAGMAVALDWVSRKERSALGYTTADAPKKSPSAPIILECHNANLPSETPPEGIIHTMDVGDPEHEVLDLGKRWSPGNSYKIAWDGIRSAYRCDVTNLGAEAVFNVLLTFKLSFHDTAPESGDTTEQIGKLVLSRDRRIRIPALAPNKPFTFYVYNKSRYFVMADAPDDAFIGGLHQENQNINLVAAGRKDLFMSPHKS
ncbi:hypothetical protein J2X36_003350 [Methylobacterium sp. BE186]|uniref:hypothetical protein n=1 Tax=Methylobacterium sp. BE186 TaxID=2817715 RepID=UPI00285B5127|nr:hypothetical protein [Methylobacterium sp. BE186]MDR7038584.1 hypothetical protein [Methylobacterium sp. BE186]